MGRAEEKAKTLCFQASMELQRWPRKHPRKGEMEHKGQGIVFGPLTNLLCPLHSCNSGWHHLRSEHYIANSRRLHWLGEKAKWVGQCPRTRPPRISSVPTLNAGLHLQWPQAAYSIIVGGCGRFVFCYCVRSVVRCG